MPDLRLKYGESYYKDIRKKRVVPARGTIQNLTEQERKELSKKGHEGKKKLRDDLKGKDLVE